MFTGIITDIGTVLRVEPRDGAALYEIETKLDLSKAAIGASIACAGICLTVISKTKNTFSVEVSNETANVTTIGMWGQGARINLESALRVGDELGGHLVSGHVDGVGVLENIKDDGASKRMEFSVPQELAMYIATKGSVCVDGVSLTVNNAERNRFGVNIIPHTLAATTLGALKAGMSMNIEVDQLARYAARRAEFGV